MVHHYPLTNSDHLPLILCLFGAVQRAPKPFKFEMFWTRDATCYGVVEKAWNRCGDSHPAQCLFKRIRSARYALRRWNKRHFGQIQEAINQVKEQLVICQKNAADQYNLDWEISLHLELE